MEYWKDIQNYEGLYAISNLGNVKSFERWIDIGMGRRQLKPEKVLKPGVASNGYLTIVLCKNNVHTTRTIHTPIAEAFIPNPSNVRCINHKDGNKLNNSISNLEWVTYSENHKHAYRVLGRKPCRKLSTDNVNEIRQLKNSGIKVPQLARMYSVKPSTIFNIVHFKTRING